VKTKQMLGLILVAAGLIDVVIAAVILDSVPRTVVFVSGVTTLGLGLILFVSGLKQGPR